ncbi:Serine/threonine protein kinase [Chondrus crispus]|uniref:Serine/threonine protein kinase n=1 Tax=Chondrus crispus TaxID=2769 RepID=R7QU95_CHOCR|nr:Serine/threonine protein kinase [Chondrus crispus]CDF41268.1 Serine/threonine protein kinase [Chondrus crispus]|eukprot:XP_005711562.1 Serine/threonine protein kinase [Chondrus crispus]
MFTGAIRRQPGKKASVKVGKYVLLDKIGVGGFGVVRRAINEENGSVVAIKILDKVELQLQEMTGHAKREIALLTKINHPNVVKGYEVLSSKTKLFLVMEYVDGGDLHSALSAKGKFSEHEAQGIFGSLLACLDYCHRQGIYHRDLKLENILLTSSGQLKICDFGLASVRTQGSNTNDLCRTIVGTEDFSPPEVLQNIPYNGGKADMWGAGILLFIMLSGYCPFQGRDSRELRERIKSCRYTFPTDFPDAAKAIVKRLLVQRGNDRPSAMDLLQNAWVKDSITEVKETEDPLSKRKSDHVTDEVQAEINVSKPPTNPKPKLNSAESLAPIAASAWQNSQNVELSALLSSGLENPSLVSSKSVRRPGGIVYYALGLATVPNFSKLIEAMQKEATGVQVQNRKWRWKLYENCFVGTDAVSWLTGHAGCTRDAAVALGQKLLDAGALHHVCRAHDFKDDALFYRWIDNEPENVLCLNLRKYWPKPVFPPDPISVSGRLLNQLSQLCKTHQQPYDYQMVEVVTLQSDALFRKFLDAVTELQVVNINPYMGTEEKIGFLVNVYNLMWLQARIHIGNVHKKNEFRTLQRKVMSLQYHIAGVRLSLGDVFRLLFGNGGNDNIGADNRTISEGSARSSTSDRILSIGGSFIVSKLLARRRSYDEKSAINVLNPGRLEPLAHFLTSECAPESPIIRAVSEKEINAEYLTEVAAEYLNVVLDVDVDRYVISYPPRVSQFRAMLSCPEDEHFLIELIRICAGRAVCVRLLEVQRRSNEDRIPVKVTAKTETELPYSISSFGPRLGYSFAVA